MLFRSLTERNVIEQLRNLRTHPSVAARLEKGNLNLHGWVYHIAQGIVTSYDAGQERFVPVRPARAEKTKGRNAAQAGS